MSDRVLAVLLEPSLFASVTADLTELGVNTLSVGELSHLSLYQQDCVPTILLCDADVTDWQAVLRFFHQHGVAGLVVFLTRLADERLWLEMLDAGAFDVLPKPYRPQDLRWVIETALKRAKEDTTRPNRAAA